MSLKVVDGSWKRQKHPIVTGEVHSHNALLHWNWISVEEIVNFERNINLQEIE